MELEAARLKREEEAAKLAAAGFPLLHLPALANPHAVLVSQTVREVDHSRLTCGRTAVAAATLYLLLSASTCRLDFLR